MTTSPIAEGSTGPADGEQPLVLVVDGVAGHEAKLDRALAAAGYRVERAASDPGVLATMESLAPDAVVLDLEQDDPTTNARNPLELARMMRAQSAAPILMLADRDSVDDLVAGLDAGADDYLTKPYSMKECLARLRALLRGRALAVEDARASARHGCLTYADLKLDQDLREAQRGDRRLELRNKAFELLACFMRHPERVLSRRELLEEAWGFDFLGDSNVIEVTVGHVRQALEAGGEPRLIHTVRPLGYILRD
jgi:two-component system response regulator MprA